MPEKSDQIYWRRNELPDCRLCVNWFLGCLNGREQWKDKAITPNRRRIGCSGKEYSLEDAITSEEYPVRMMCDDFRWDPNEERLGRAVW